MLLQGVKYGKHIKSTVECAVIQEHQDKIPAKLQHGGGEHYVYIGENVVNEEYNFLFSFSMSLYWRAAQIVEITTF